MLQCSKSTILKSSIILSYHTNVMSIEKYQTNEILLVQEFRQGIANT